MGRILDRMQGGLRQVQAFTDRRDSKKKAACLYILAILIGVLAAVRACILLVNLSLVSAIFYVAVAALAVMGCHATRHRHRSLLVLYVACMTLAAGLALLGLILSLIPGVLTLTFHVDIIFVAILVVVEGLSVIVAYSLSKDLNPSKHAHAGDAMEAGEQVISFDDQQTPNEFQLPASSQPQSPQHAEAAMYHHQAPAMVTPLGGMMPVYDPATGTYSGYAAQPMYASAYGPPAGQQFAFSGNPYAPAGGQPAAVFNFASFPPEQASPAAAPTTATAAAPAPAYDIGEDDDEFDPFQEAK